VTEPAPHSGQTPPRHPEPPFSQKKTVSRLRFTRAQRIQHSREFEAVYAAKVRKPVGPLIVFGLPNQTGMTRLGLSVGRRVGGAVTRNRVKRLLREAFRLDQADLPLGLDLVISVKPHQILHLEVYRRLLLDAARSIRGEWDRRARRAERHAEVGTPSPDSCSSPGSSSATSPPAAPSHGSA